MVDEPQVTVAVYMNVARHLNAVSHGLLEHSPRYPIENDISPVQRTMSRDDKSETHSTSAFVNNLAIGKHVSCSCGGGTVAFIVEQANN